MGDRKGKKNGWARIYLDDRPAGAFGTYKGGFSSTWVSQRLAGKISRTERAEIRAKREADQQSRAADRAAQHETVAGEAQALLASAKPATSHPYLDRKRVGGEGLFLKGRCLLVPVQDAAGKVWNVQRIYADGTKLFLKGGRVDGLFWLVETSSNDGMRFPLCIGEGVGTMAAVP